MSDPLNPKHYTDCSIEPMDVIEDWGLPHHLACVVKYIKRHTLKGSPVQDLEKARWYLDRYLEALKTQPRRLPLDLDISPEAVETIMRCWESRHRDEG